MIITSEYVYKKNKLIETRNILQNAIEEFEKEYGFNVNRDVKVECVGKFLDKIKNEKKLLSSIAITLLENSIR